MRINILHLIDSERNKARKENNIKYYKKLLTDKAFKVSPVDYNFMQSHRKQFNKHPKFISYEKNLCMEENKEIKEKLFNAELKIKEKERAIKALKQQNREIQIEHENKISDFKKSLKKPKEAILTLKDKEKSHIQNQMNSKRQVKSLTLCKQDMVYASSSAKNATDYASKGNHKYALIEIKEALLGTQLALESCKGNVDTLKMDELSKNLSSLNKTRKKIEYKLSRNSPSKTRNTNMTTSKANCYYYDNLSNKTIQSANVMISQGNIGQALEEAKRAKEYTSRAIRECNPYGDVSNLESTLNMMDSAIIKMKAMQ